jgi:carbamoyltransferase|tara:strand:+ start:247 stop:1665 length:1419 start_codon:yes stop_codon:yes gene_type:complete
MKVLGFSEGFHDAAVTVLDDGEVLFAAHSERFSKKKNDKFVCEELKDYAKQYEADTVAFYERPLIKRTRQVYSKQWKSAFKKRPLAYECDYYFAHHLSHAAAAFQCSPFTDAIALVVDAIGEWDTVSTWRCNYYDGKANYTKLDSIRYPTSIGLFYSAVTDRVGLKPMEEEYITMGMAAFGRANKKLYDELTYMLGFKNLHRGMRGLLTEYSDEDIAHNAQKLVENLLRTFINKSENLPIVYGGGVALNSVANGMMFLNKQHYIFPNPGDAGSSLGAAALVHRKKINYNHSFHGYDLPLLNANDINHVVDILEKGEPVGIAAGKAEFGPRALGNRSLLCDPRTAENKDRVNEIKRRQKFRPFAPSILSEYAGKYFRIKPESNFNYMQNVTRAWDKSFEATIHVDGSARVHTVDKDTKYVSPLRHILQAWYERTGCPALLNTSLNIKGQPMVNDAQDAKAFEKEYGVEVVCNG